MSKKILSMLLVLAMLAGIVAVMPMTASAEVTASNADIVINSVDDWMNKLSGKTIGDQTVFVNATELDFDGEEVLPINGFKGHFNGNGVIIRNMEIVTSGETGIFGCIEAAVIIENLVIEDSYFYGVQWVGAVACCAGHGSDEDVAIFRNIYVGQKVYVEAPGKKSGSNINVYAGGIVGGVAANGGLEVTDCVFEGDVACEQSNGRYMGRIVGNINGKTNVTIYNCLATGTITNGKSSGISGIMDGSSTEGSEIDFCISILPEGTNITSGRKYSGGVTAGDYNWSVLSNVYGLNAMAASEEDPCYIGDVFTVRDNDVMIPNGVKALEELNPDFTVPNSIYYGTIAEKSAITFQNWDGTILETKEWEAGAMPTYSGATPTKPDDDFVTYVFDGWDPEIKTVGGEAVYTAKFKAELKTEAPAEVDGEYVISNVYQWFYLINNVDEFEGATIVLGADLDFEGADEFMEPISGFAGTFDGKGYAIKNVYMSKSQGDIALFDDLGDNATITNFVIKSSTFEIKSNGNWLAAVACCTSGVDVTISNVYVDKDVVVKAAKKDNNSIAAGILGGVYGDGGAVVTVSDCVFAGTVTGTGNYVAGIVANAQAGNDILVINCTNVGTVISKGTLAAGIAVSGGITIENCVNAGKVAGTKYVGGIYAGNPTDDIVITNCYTVGNFEGHNTANGGAVIIEGGVEGLDLNELTGLNAKVPATFTKRVGDFAMPTGCTVAYGIHAGLSLVDGASIRLSSPTGLRFTAVLGAAYLESFMGEGKTVTYGIIIAPKDYVDEAGEFTVEALDALDEKRTNYIEIEAAKCTNNPEADGSYVFTGVITNIKDYNYERDFSAIAYVKVVENGEATYYYSEYDESVNSRSVAYVAEKAYEDTNPVATDRYQYALDIDVEEEVDGTITNVTKTVYSPYTVDQRDTLLGFFELGEQ